MRISAKSRYGLAAMVKLAQKYSPNEYITVISVAEELKISKIYLEQVFSLLKKSNVILSVKGSQGGYQLSKPADQITVLEILQAVEQAIFEKTEQTVPDSAQDIESALQNKIFAPLDQAVTNTLSQTTLQDLVNEAKKYVPIQPNMYFI